jgi:hypothetical protein
MAPANDTPLDIRFKDGALLRCVAEGAGDVNFCCPIVVDGPHQVNLVPELEIGFILGKTLKWEKQNKKTHP